MFAKFTLRLVINLRIGHTPHHPPTIADKNKVKLLVANFGQTISVFGRVLCFEKSYRLRLDPVQGVLLVSPIDLHIDRHLAVKLI